MAFTIGCDPEFFIKKNHKHLAAIGLIGGSKEFPRPLKREGFAILEDNVAVEFNIAPCHNHQEFIEGIRYVMDGLKKQLNDFDFSEESAVIFDADQLTHPQALEFGCEPDFNAWTKDINPRPQAADQALRSAGGHVHVGTKEDPIEVIRAMDLFLGVPAHKLDVHGKLRRELYGKAGSFRPKPYGCEYRTLSNFWIFQNEMIEWVYNQTAKAIAFVESGNVVEEKDGHLIQQCINHSSDEAYAQLAKTYAL